MKKTFLFLLVLLPPFVSAFNIDQNFYTDQNNLYLTVTATCQQDPLNPTNYQQGEIIDYITFLCFGKNCSLNQKHNLLYEPQCDKTTKSTTMLPTDYKQVGIITMAKQHANNQYDYQKITIKEKTTQALWDSLSDLMQQGTEENPNYIVWAGIIFLIVGIILSLSRIWWSYVIIITSILIIVLGFLFP